MECELELYSTCNSGFFAIIQSLRRAPTSRQPAPTDLRIISPRQVSPKVLRGRDSDLGMRQLQSTRRHNIGIFGSGETHSAQYSFALRRLKWDSCVTAALRASNVCFDCPPSSAAMHLCLAVFAVLRFVDKSLFSKELLFSRRKSKRRTATYTQDISVNKGHNAPSKLSRFREGSTEDSSPSGKLVLRGTS